jgi:hypothetical protein
MRQLEVLKEVMYHELPGWKQTRPGRKTGQVSGETRQASAQAPRRRRRNRKGARFPYVFKKRRDVEQNKREEMS